MKKEKKQTNRLNTELINKLAQKKEVPNADLYFQKIRDGNRIYLSKAITLIESNNPEYYKIGQQILKKCLPFSGNSIRIGITGVPGVGKSTFIEALGKEYIKTGHKVAVLAIDPSSSLSKGSILGDKTRMELLSKNKNAFIRPTASGNQLGGVAQKTRETIILCEAAGFNKILIETVGVGQSETMVASMTDFFLLLKLAGAGDELQGIKRGIIEMADLIVINKAEGDNLTAAKIAKKTFETALHYYPPKNNNWQPKVVLSSALYHKGIDEIVQIINNYETFVKNNHTFEKKRKQQDLQWFEENIKQKVMEYFYKEPFVVKNIEKIKNLISSKKISVYEGVEKLIQNTLK